MSAEAATVKVTEIAAANVRSSLQRLESESSNLMQRLENIAAMPAAAEAAAAAAAAASSSGPPTQTVPTPVVIHPDRKAPADILTALEQLIIRAGAADAELDELTEFPLPSLDEISHLALVSHSITAYLSYLPRRQLVKFTTRILADTGRWLASMFRFVDAAASYHTDSSECLTRALRLALHAKFPGYYDNGIASLPLVALYVAETSSHVGLQHACRQIGLPLNSIRLVPSLSVGTNTCMDVSALQKCVAIDLNASRMPLFVVADVGASLGGEVDNVTRIQEICHVNGIWLHARGHCIASLACTEGAASNPTPVADSITLNLGNWLGVPGLPTVLLYPAQAVPPPGLFDTDPLLTRYLSATSAWIVLQAFGRDLIVERLLLAFHAVQVFFDIVSKVEGLRVISKPPLPDIQLKEILGRPLSPLVLFEAAQPSVVFQFHGQPIESGGADASPNEEETVTETTPEKSESASSSYYDRLNSWLGQILQRDSAQIDIEIIDHPTYGTCLRFCPLELSVGELPPTMEYLENFGACLDAQVDILRATVKHKRTFNRLAEESPVLRLIELADWAGLGGVRFVPEFFDLLTDQSKTELNRLNISLVDHLRATDSAFSLGEGADGLVCVRFGMVTEDTDVAELLDLVVQAGRVIQEDSKVLDSMAEIVKKGIEAATQDLQRESEEKLWQEGILRHVPVVGSVVNWFSPPSKEGGVRGRTLNLQQGKVEITENLYKYHMQTSSNQVPGKETPAEQTSAEDKVTRSRNASESSTTSAAAAANATNPTTASPTPPVSTPSA